MVAGGGRVRGPAPAPSWRCIQASQRGRGEDDRLRASRNAIRRGLTESTMTTSGWSVDTPTMRAARACS